VLLLYAPRTGTLAKLTSPAADESIATEAFRLLALQAELGRLLLGTDTLQKMLGRCTEVIVRLLDASFVRVWTLNERENLLELQASSGMYTHLDGLHSRIQVGQYKIGLIAQERLPHLTNKVVGDPRVSDQDWAIREGMKSFAGYPLLVEDQLLGVLGMFSRKELPPATIDAIGAAANFIALGIRRKTSEESLQASEEFSRRVLASSSECIKILDLDYHIKYMNPGGMKLLEIDDFGVCENADWCSFWQEQDRSAVGAAIEQALAGGVGNFHAFCKTFKGTPKWWDVVVSPIRNADGKVVKLLASSRDATERKRAEAAEKENLEKLSAMVEERTANLRREVNERKKAEADLRKLSSQLLTLRDTERRRIARDLHDSLGQILTAATINVAMVDRQKANLDAKGQEALADTGDMLQQAMKEVRVVSQLLHPPLLDEAGLGAALQIYAQGISERGDLQVELSIDEDFERLSLELETTIFRIVQECLTNVHRHSGSKKARVGVARSGSEIIVQVSDEGRGIGAHEASGIGLRGMRERVAQVLGTLTIKSGSGGTMIEARLPAEECSDGSRDLPGIS
jgi:PAS domain S-box-containing protein